MAVDIQTVQKVANLCKLEFTDEEQIKMAADMNNILTYIDKLNEVDTEGVEPLIFLSEEVNQWRDDVPVVTISKEQALKNAPLKDSDYFKVPKFMDRD
jgi:aspartyl-tRNA(Asn)/glutamyl-tRNA(Gln) amidotransferase subunit C